MAIVTGAASGIGRALATELVDRGATVVVSDIAAGEAGRVAEQLARRAGPDRAVAATLDVTDAAAIDDLVSRTAAEHGGLDLLFNNAGIGVGGE
ncbi:MAG TPA: SDR family NAD(P)-dependent oxidoreductase, partial [Acidimicrobiales bacterium]|nr:SDR family NAD(P)-dependent oxidoreductase [Acidimicrobiales bacterium]